MVALRFFSPPHRGIVVVDSDQTALFQELVAKLVQVDIGSVEIVLQGMVHITPVDEDHDAVVSIHHGSLFICFSFRLRLWLALGLRFAGIEFNQGIPVDFSIYHVLLTEIRRESVY